MGHADCEECGARIYAKAWNPQKYCQGCSDEISTKLKESNVTLKRRREEAENNVHKIENRLKKARSELSCADNGLEVNEAEIKKRQSISNTRYIPSGIHFIYRLNSWCLIDTPAKASEFEPHFRDLVNEIGASLILLEFDRINTNIHFFAIKSAVDKPNFFCHDKTVLGTIWAVCYPENDMNQQIQPFSLRAK